MQAAVAYDRAAVELRGLAAIINFPLANYVDCMGADQRRAFESVPAERQTGAAVVPRQQQGGSASGAAAVGDNAAEPAGGAADEQGGGGADDAGAAATARRSTHVNSAKRQPAVRGPPVVNAAAAGGGKRLSRDGEPFGGMRLQQHQEEDETMAAHHLLIPPPPPHLSGTELDLGGFPALPRPLDHPRELYQPQQPPYYWRQQQAGGLQPYFATMRRILSEPIALPSHPGRSLSHQPHHLDLFSPAGAGGGQVGPPLHERFGLPLFGSLSDASTATVAAATAAAAAAGGAPGGLLRHLSGAPLYGVHRLPPAGGVWSSHSLTSGLPMGWGPRDDGEDQGVEVPVMGVELADFGGADAAETVKPAGQRGGLLGDDEQEATGGGGHGGLAGITPPRSRVDGSCRTGSSSPTAGGTQGPYHPHLTAGRLSSTGGGGHAAVQPPSPQLAGGDQQAALLPCAPSAPRRPPGSPLLFINNGRMVLMDQRGGYEGEGKRMGEDAGEARGGQEGGDGGAMDGEGGALSADGGGGGGAAAGGGGVQCFSSRAGRPPPAAVWMASGGPAPHSAVAQHQVPLEQPVQTAAGAYWLHPVTTVQRYG